MKAIFIYSDWKWHIGLANWNVNNPNNPQTTHCSPASFQNANPWGTVIAGGVMNDKKGQLIRLERPSKRKQPALPPLSSMTQREDWSTSCLIGSWSSGGSGDHAVLLPFTVLAGGRRESNPRHQQPQVGFVVCHRGPVAPNCLSALYQTDKQQEDLPVHVWVHIQYLHKYICMGA